MTLGFDRDMYVLPFDHRGTFETKMFGWEGPLTADQTAQIAAAKLVIYAGANVLVAGTAIFDDTEDVAATRRLLRGTTRP